MIRPLAGILSSGNKNIVTPGNDSYTKLLLHMDGTGSSFVDSCSAPHNPTPHGTVTQSATQFKFGSKSGYFDGTAGCNLTLPANVLFFGGVNVTIDCWVYLTGTNTMITWDDNYDNWDRILFYVNTVGAHVTMMRNGGASINMGFTEAIPQNTWFHIAYVRNGTDRRIYYNGVSKAAVATASYQNNTGTQPIIGNGLGYLDEHRLSIGIARWTANFTPPPSMYV